MDWPGATVTLSAGSVTDVAGTGLTTAVCTFKDGGVLESVHELEVETLPMSIPESIVVDISELKLGDSLHVRDLSLGENVTLLAEPDEVVAIIVVPRSVEESTVEEEPVEVEVVAKGKAAKSEEEQDN